MEHSAVSKSGSKTTTGLLGSLVKSVSKATTRLTNGNVRVWRRAADSSGGGGSEPLLHRRVGSLPDLCDMLLSAPVSVTVCGDAAARAELVVRDHLLGLALDGEGISQGRVKSVIP